MVLLDGLEKLITEHGSAAILKERIALANDKYSLLEQKNAQLIAERTQFEAKITVLENDKQSLKSQIYQAEKEIKRLTEIIEAGTKHQSSKKLDKIKESILKALFEANRDCDVSQFASTLRIDESLVRYHVDDLKDKGLINIGQRILNSPITYCISQTGRKYVVEEIST